MQHGYEQVVVGRQVVWKRQGFTVKEWVAWLVDEVQEFL